MNKIIQTCTWSILIILGLIGAIFALLILGKRLSNKESNSKNKNNYPHKKVNSSDYYWRK